MGEPPVPPSLAEILMAEANPMVTDAPVPQYATVRIAVAINPQGHWRTCGNAALPDKTVLGILRSATEDTVVWVTASVPIPEPKPLDPEIRGVIEAVKREGESWES